MSKFWYFKKRHKCKGFSEKWKFEIIMQLSTLKTIRTGFPILCPGTSDPFKNKTELRSFDYFTPVFFVCYNFSEAKNTQKEIS